MRWTWKCVCEQLRGSRPREKRGDATERRTCLYLLFLFHQVEFFILVDFVHLIGLAEVGSSEWGQKTACVLGSPLSKNSKVECKADVLPVGMLAHNAPLPLAHMKARLSLLASLAVAAAAAWPVWRWRRRGQWWRGRGQGPWA
jgi:hypothetical protein